MARRFPEANANAAALTLTLPHDGSLTTLRRLLAESDDDAVTGRAVHTADLDDVFLALTDHPIADESPEEVPA